MAETSTYKLPEISLKYSSRLISRVVSTTFLVISVLLTASLVVILTVRMNITIDASGQLKPMTSIILHSPVDGKIKEICARGGESFRKGQVLVQFDSSKLMDQINQLKNDLSIKEMTLAMKEKTVPLDIEEDSLAVNKARAQVLSADANFRERVVDFFPGANMDSLMKAYKKGTHVALDIAYAQIISAESDLANLQTNRKVVELNSHVDEGTLALQISELRDQLGRRRDYLQKTRLTAPFDGIVLTDNIRSLDGTVVSQGAPLFEISQTNEWKAALNVTEKDIYKISVGDSVRVEVNAMKLSGEYLMFPGKILAISAEPEENSSNQPSGRSYSVNVSINVTHAQKYVEKFKSGFTVDAKIIKHKDRIINVILKHIGSAI